MSAAAQCFCSSFPDDNCPLHGKRSGGVRRHRTVYWEKADSLATPFDNSLGRNAWRAQSLREIERAAAAEKAAVYVKRVNGEIAEVRVVFSEE